jgi:hypothetical protein
VRQQHTLFHAEAPVDAAAHALVRRRCASCSQMALMRKLRKGGSAFFLRKARAAYTSWAEQALKGASRQRKMAAALKRMSPEGRALAAGFGAFKDLFEQLQALRRAVSGFVNGSIKKAFTMWIEATFDVRAPPLPPSPPSPPAPPPRAASARR